MSLHYFIDGYNLIRSTDWLSEGTLDQQRERLVRYVDEVRPTGNKSNTVSVVFDGKPGRSLTLSRNGIDAVFTLSLDADSFIKRAVDSLSNPRTAVVVTNDKAIQRWVKGAKAKVLSCEEFLSPKTKQFTPIKMKKIDARAAMSITRELKKAWL